MFKLDIINDKISSIMSKAGDLIILNILILICSLPIITIGTAITTGYDICLRIVRNEQPSVIKLFFPKFKVNFKSSFKLWLLALSVILISIADFSIGTYFPQLNLICKLAGSIQLFILCLILLYAFPLTARYENSLKATIKNSIIFAIYYLPYTIFMFLISISPIIMFSLPNLSFKAYSTMQALFFIIWIALIIFINSFIVNKLFIKQFGDNI